MKKLSEKFRTWYHHASLASKIRLSYFILLIPVMFFVLYCIYNIWNSNRQYSALIQSTAVASDFSLDFKKDFDYETYLVVAGNKTVEESELQGMLNQANWVVDRLEKESYSGTDENMKRLRTVRKYLVNLQTYIDRIQANLEEGNMYEDNIEIWENDVQIVTSLVRETFFQYIYYDVENMQAAKEAFQREYYVMMGFSAIVILVLTIVLGYSSYKIPLGITRPIIELSKVTDQVAKGNLSVRSEVYDGVEAKMLGDSLNTMIDKINELLSQVTTEQIRLRKAEFELLQAQINPHFLYNTLDAIVWLAEAGEQEMVVKMVGSLSDFFRTSLNQGKDVVTIQEELQHVRSYLSIQQVRYQDILQYDIQVPKELYAYYIPKITLQPIVENALYHGIKNKRGLGHITIHGREDQDGFVLSVEDDGIGMTEEKLAAVKHEIKHMESKEKVVYGLYNIHERIRLNFGENYGITISSIYGQGTTVEVHLPKRTTR